MRSCLAERASGLWTLAMTGLAGLALAGCGGKPARPPLAASGGLGVLAGYSYPTTGGAGAAYLHIRNASSAADTLLAVQSGGQKGILMTTEGIRMTMVEQVPLAQGSEVAMRPGGMHVMFDGLAQPSVVGDTISLLLRFARAGELTVRVPVVRYGEMPE